MSVKITIITPSFNQVAFLEQTIDSVLSQNYTNLEYIIIDGGSTDSSVEVIKKYQRHLAYWVSEKDQGQSHAINKGLRRATGEVVNWINSDDYYEPGALKFVASSFSDPAVNVLCARSNIVRNERIIQRSNGTDVYENNLAKTIGWARIDQPETFFRLKAYHTIGLLNELLHYVMDREWWIRYLLYYGLNGIVKSDKIIANFRLHNQSKTETRKIDFEMENFKLFYSLADLSGLASRFSEFDESFGMKSYFVNSWENANDQVIDKAISYFLLQRADKEYYAGNSAKALGILSKLDRNSFSPADQNLIRKIAFRSRFLPEGFRKLVRSWMSV